MKVDVSPGMHLSCYASGLVLSTAPSHVRDSLEI